MRNVFGVVAHESTGAIDKKMVDSAIIYNSTLQSGGTDFSQNEYVKNHILEALVINDESIRSVAARLGVNRKFLPSIVDKRKEYDKLCVAKRIANSEGLLNQDDQTLESTSESFIMGMGPDELGMQHLFAALHIDPEDDFFYDNAPEGEKKEIRNKNYFKEHLSAKKRRLRRDCPKYIEVVRNFVHSTFRPDTFAKRKVMIKNEDGTYYYHLPHIQNNSIKDTHNSFMESEIYHDWQHQNRWR